MLFQPWFIEENSKRKKELREKKPTFSEDDAPRLVVELVLVTNDAGCGVAAVQVGEGFAEVGRQLQYQVVEHLAAARRRKDHLKVVRVLVDVEEQAALVALVQRHALDHLSREQPVVHLATLALLQ